MLKKSILVLMLTSITSLGFAGNAYLGPGLQYESIEANKSYQAVSPRITLGYGGALNESYGLAAELFAAAGTVENHPSNSGLKNTPNAGISILPSILFGEKWLGFGRLGLITASFSAQDNNTWGAQAGLGLEASLMHSWDIRAEYVYTAYENVSMEGSPKSNSFIMSLLYQFK